MYRKPRDAGAAAAAAKAGDKAKSKPTPKVALKKRSATAAGASSSLEPSSPSGAATGAAAGGNAAGPPTRKRPTKLRAARERRARDRSMDEDEDLELKFSNLSVAAPAFVPGRAFGGSGAVAAPSPSLVGSGSGSAKPRASAPLLNGRSLAFVTERGGSAADASAPKRLPPPSSESPSLRSLGAAAEAQEKAGGTARASAAVERRPRRPRIGAMGFSKTPGGVQGRVTRQAGAPAGPSLSLKPRLTDDGSGLDAAFQQRPRSDSAGSDSDYGSDDEVYPEEPSSGATSAFPGRLTLFAQQKHIPKKVSRDVVIDTIFEALFAKQAGGSGGRARGGFSAFGDDTGTDTDEPNEEFVKRGLAASLFKDSLNARLLPPRANETQQETVDRFLTPALLHALVTDMRFEDFRTASARLDILRAIHRNFPRKRLPIARALVDATHLRLAYVAAVGRAARVLSVEKSVVAGDNRTDHGHGWTELLRYAIEHAAESLHGFGVGDAPLGDRDARELLRNYMLSLLALWRAHCLDPAGSDDEELISCAGQFVSYLPEATVELLQRLLTHWPSRYPAQEVVAIRMAARVVMSSPPLHSFDGPAAARLPAQLFARLARAVQSPHVQVAQEALAFTGCQFAMTHFLGRYDEIYRVVTEAFHANS
ncbi:hypothetical protein PybrP1_006596 [[Pythium] brassicae (nom. inval.)]|nr:hypothetical protein PybrP1_006596 [[Pythium] brassicae (nom. inval.)]